ncbi:hypothetical protein AB1Y20_016980 [Prymnesium parvum]|uniref:Leucine-rich repeat-containing N-terminal plant-type domain-containing protein n=1 Tax=Prymnesium parvum TaxID=97485 RepID=A0AB34I8H9_PRYPA
MAPRARLLLVLPASLLLTWCYKQAALPHRFALDPPIPSSSSSPSPSLHTYSSAPACPPRQREALLALSRALRLARWDADDCCTWPGVGCDERGLLRTLDLSRRRLEGTLPPDVRSLSSLRTLDVNGNEGLRGTLPSELGSLPELRALYAFGTRLSGTLPASLLSLPSLRELELSDARLSGTLPASIATATSLRYLYLAGNRLSGTLPPSLASLPALRELDAASNALSGTLPAALASRRLDHLGLEANPGLAGWVAPRVGRGCAGGEERHLRGQQRRGEAAPP